jgi:hypothetical protein
MCKIHSGDWHEPVQWPLKIMRISPLSPFFHNARLLIAADCAAYSYEGFAAVARDKVLVIGCPDGYGMSFYEKLAQIVKLNDIREITLIHMDADCCARVTDAVILAIRCSGRDIPLRKLTVFTVGEIVD